MSNTVLKKCLCERQMTSADLFCDSRIRVLLFSRYLWGNGGKIGLPITTLGVRGVDWRIVGAQDRKGGRADSGCPGFGRIDVVRRVLRQRSVADTDN
jgi:hypothetical protein